VLQTFRNPKDQLLALLKESAPAGEQTNGATASKPEKKRQKTSRNVDMEKLAEALPQLQEDDLLQVVQMVHDNKTDDTYTKNDVESKSYILQHLADSVCVSATGAASYPRRSQAAPEAY